MGRYVHCGNEGKQMSGAPLQETHFQGLCILTGMAGTIVMPMLEKRIGLERAGAWSIW